LGEKKWSPNKKGRGEKGLGDKHPKETGRGATSAFFAWDGGGGRLSPQGGNQKTQRALFKNTGVTKGGKKMGLHFVSGNWRIRKQTVGGNEKKKVENKPRAVVKVFFGELKGEKKRGSGFAHKGSKGGGGGCVRRGADTTSLNIGRKGANGAPIPNGGARGKTVGKVFVFLILEKTEGENRGCVVGRPKKKGGAKS